MNLNYYYYYYYYYFIFIIIMKWSIEIFKCKIWPLLDFLAKFRYVLACLCSQFFYNYSHARILVKVFSVVPKFVNYALYNEDF